MHGCVFCTEKFKRLMQLIGHLIDHHPKMYVEVGAGEMLREFKVYKANMRHGRSRCVLCFCGEKFTQNRIELPQPLFGGEVLLDDKAETNSFMAHLLREGGLEGHLRKLRNEALMDRVAGKSHSCAGRHERGG